jgi:hypothetical protein
MKNILPLLFWTIIGSSILNTDNITHITPYRDYHGSHSIIYFNTSERVNQNSLQVSNASPAEVWEIMVKNRIN